MRYMEFKFFICFVPHCLFLLLLSLGVHCDDGSEVNVKLLSNPREISNRNSATFAFQVLVGGNGSICSDCYTNCRLDSGIYSACVGGKISYTSLVDGNHSFMVCTNVSFGVSCTGYNWTVDTINPTASITASTSFTSVSHVSVNISFSEPCAGFTCSSVNDCNLLVYGAGMVEPNTINVIQLNLKYSIVVSLLDRIQFGRLILVMDKDFCTDSAGNVFKRTENSSYLIHFDRRDVYVNVRTHIPQRLISINSDHRAVLATNKKKNLKLYLYFTEPVLNSSAEILNSINTSQGTLVPINGDSFGQRRFGYQLTDIPELAIVTVSMATDLVITRQGTSVAPVLPVTFLYDSQRPTARLSTRNMRTKEKSIHVVIKFMKPVFGFNSSHISISGGQLQSFLEVSRSIYAVYIQAVTNIISINIPENVTADVSGNRNRPSNTLQVRHYSVPVESMVISFFVTAVFAVTCLIAILLTVSTTTLLSVGAFSRPSSILTSDPARNLFRIAHHIQVFALSKWLAVTVPIEYYELTRGLQWSIPYFELPWEKGNVQPILVESNSNRNRLRHSYDIHDSMIFEGSQSTAGSLDSEANAYGLPLTPLEYRTYFESQNIVPLAEYISDPRDSHGWRDFSRSMFWLSVIGGTFILVHALLLFILKFKKKDKEKRSFGALIFPRFEIFLLILALPCLCEASAALIKGGTSSGKVIGILILSFVAFQMLSFFLFLSFGITLGKLLQYKEVHHEGQEFHWYQEIIRVILGPGKRGQWTWKNRPRSIYLTIFGPLFEDLRGPPKYMLSQISGPNLNKTGDRIIASDDETEDAEAPIIQKFFGILRIYYAFIDCAKRVILGVMAGAYSEKYSSRIPTVALLCITCGQLFFMILKKPFIKKKVQLVEIISVSSELAIFAFFLIFLGREFSEENKRKMGISMISLFLIVFMAQMINEWYALFRQIKNLDPIKKNFLRGLETSLTGILFFLLPRTFIKNLEKRFPINNETGDTASSVDRNISSGSRSSGDKPWLRQIRELARSSFNKEGSAKSTSNDPSTSNTTKRSGFWRSKVSGTSSASTSIDYKSKPKGLHKELEDIFASK